MAVALPGVDTGAVDGPSSSIDNDIVLFNGTTGKLIKDSGQTIAQILAPYTLQTRNINTTAPLSGGGNLTADRTLAIAKATTSVDGYLAAADFITFNNKVSTTRAINTTAPLSGGGNLSADRTLAIAQATTSVDGYLAATDFVTFNNKIGVVTNSDGSITASTVSTTSTVSVNVGHTNVWTIVQKFNSTIGILETGSTPTKYTFFQGGDQTADITYTLPTAVPAGSGYVLTSTTGGVWSWTAPSVIGGVTSVTNSDSSLTFSPTTGNVVGSINVGNTNIWTVAQKFNGTLGILETGSSPTKYTFLQGGDQSADITYTLPVAVPAGNGYLLSSTTGGVWSWINPTTVGPVSSVSNSDSTLTISPTTGAVVASLNLSHANTWAALQTFGNNISYGGAQLNVTSLTSGDLLQYNGTNWVNVTKASINLVTSVSNSDSTLTISPTTGAVVASINLSHANTWAALQTFGNNISYGGAQLNVTSLTSGDLLQYNGTNWINVTKNSINNILSVSNSDSTLTISPTTGSVVASLNLGHANTWSALQTFGNNISYGGKQLNVTSLATGDLLQNNGTNWVNVTVASIAPVQSVSNSDSSLTISPTTGSVVASLNVGHANTWTAIQKFNNTIGILETGTSPTKYTFFQGGDQTADITYTLPVAIPGSSGYVLTSTTGGVWSWTNPTGLGLVNSVSNSDGTLTISPTTGSVVASINLAHANSWTAEQDITISGTLAATTYGMQIVNTNNPGFIGGQSTFGMQVTAGTIGGASASLYGLSAVSDTFSGATVGTNYGVKGFAFTSASTVTNQYGGYFTSGGASGGLVNSYGIYASGSGGSGINLAALLDGATKVTGILECTSEIHSNLWADDIIQANYIELNDTGNNLTVNTTASLEVFVTSQYLVTCTDTQFSGMITVGGTTNFGGIAYTWPGSQSGTQYLSNNGSGTLSWASLVTGVSSVSNSDGTLTISPTTGAVVASLNLAHSNTWTGVAKYNINNTLGFVVEQTGVKSNVLACDTTNGRVGINMGPSNPLDVTGTVRFSSNSATAFLCEQTGVNSNVVVIDTTNQKGRMGIGQAPSVYLLDVFKASASSDSPGRFTSQTSNTSTVANGLKIKVLSTGTAADGLGINLQWILTDSSGSTENINNQLTSERNGANGTANFWIYGATTGTLNRLFAVANTGQVYIQQTVSTSSAISNAGARSINVICQDASNNNCGIDIRYADSAGGARPAYVTSLSTGTFGSPGALTSSREFYLQAHGGYGNAQAQTGALWRYVATQLWSGTQRGTKVTLEVCALSTTTLNVVMSATGAGIAFGNITPTAYAHCAAGTATAGTAPLKFNSGTNLTAVEAGAMEFDGTQLYFSPSATRQALIQDNGTRLTSGRIPFATTSGYLNDNAAMAYASNVVSFDADLKLTTAGRGLYIKEGTNATMGSSTLVLGTATVSTTKVTASSRIFLTVESLGTITIPKTVAVTARSAGTSFTITSSDLTDTSVVAWVIVEPA